MEKHTDALLERLRRLDVEIRGYSNEAERARRLLERAVNSKVSILEELSSKHKIRNTEDLRVYLVSRQKDA
jgi:hypothetical protein